MPENPLDPALRRIVDAYRTCELVTVSRSGTPIAWPTTSVYRPGPGTFVISTSIGFPQKAINVRREPRVALLFSEPIGSGLDGEPQVLVRGTAVCPEDVSAGFVRDSDLWRRIFAFQPSSRLYPSTPVTRRLMDAYFMRLFITITPTSIEARAPLTGRSSLEPGSASAAARSLARYPSSVLAALDETGAPVLTRVTAHEDGEQHALRISAPRGLGMVAGSASLLSHGHDEKLWGLTSVVVTGAIVEDGTDLSFRPERVVPGSSGNSPAAALRTIRTLRSTAARYLGRRGLARPRIAWAEYRSIVPLIDETAAAQRHG